jgi:hypothetical protein
MENGISVSWEIRRILEDNCWLYSFSRSDIKVRTTPVEGFWETVIHGVNAVEADDALGDYFKKHPEVSRHRRVCDELLVVFTPREGQ